MNLKSFIIRSNKGIFTETNVQTIKRVVFKPRATQRENRWGEICYQGYGDTEKYLYSKDFESVYTFSLVAMRGKNVVVIMDLPDEATGHALEGYIWATIMNNPKQRMIDLTTFSLNLVNPSLLNPSSGVAIES